MNNIKKGQIWQSKKDKKNLVKVTMVCEFFVFFKYCTDEFQDEHSCGKQNFTLYYSVLGNSVTFSKTTPCKAQ